MFIYKNEIIYTLDGNSNNYQSFDIAVQYFKNNFKIIEKKYYPPFWDSGIMDFELNNISIKIIFDDMTGTNLSIDKNISKEEISKVIKWCEDICKIIKEKSELPNTHISIKMNHDEI